MAKEALQNATAGANTGSGERTLRETSLLIGVEEVAALLQCSPRHVYRLADLAGCPGRSRSGPCADGTALPLNAGSSTAASHAGRARMTPCECRNGPSPGCSGCDGNCQCDQRGAKETPQVQPAGKPWEHLRQPGPEGMLARLLSAGTATADDVIAAVTLPPEIDPRCLGAVPGPLARAGIIRSDGFVKSPTGAARLLHPALDAGRPRRAHRWLAMHPDRPDPLPACPAGKMLFDIETLEKQRPAAVTVGRIQKGS